MGRVRVAGGKLQHTPDVLSHKRAGYSILAQLPP